MRRHCALVRLVILDILFVLGEWPFGGDHGLVHSVPRTWVAQTKEEQKAESKGKSTSFQVLASEKANHQEGGKDLDASRHESPREPGRDHECRPLEVPMRLDQPRYSILVPFLPAALYSSQVCALRKVKIAVSQEEAACTSCKARDEGGSLTSFCCCGGARGREQEGNGTGPMVELNATVQAFDPTAGWTESQRVRFQRQYKQRSAHEADRGIQGKSGREHYTRRQGRIRQDVGQQCSAFETLARHQSGSSTQGFPERQDCNPRNGSGMDNLCHLSSHQVQLPAQGLHEGKRGGSDDHGGEKTSMGGCQGRDSPSGDGQEGRGQISHPQHGGDEETGGGPSETMGGAAQENSDEQLRTRRGRGHGGYPYEGPNMRTPQETQDEWVEGKEELFHAPWANFKAAGFSLCTSLRNLYAKFDVSKKQMGMLFILFLLAGIFWTMRRLRKTKRICRCRKVRHERIARKHFVCSLSTKRILVRCLCQYLFLWYHLGFPCAQISRRDLMALRDGFHAQQEETSWMQTQRPTFHEYHDDLEEVHVKELLKDIIDLRHTTSIVVWQHPVLSRWMQVSAAKTVILDPWETFLPQITRQLPRIEEWNNRRWTRLELNINWGFARRPHLIVTEHHSFESLDSILVDFQNGRNFLGTILVPRRQQQPIHTAFELLHGENQCHRGARCFLKYGEG